MTKADKIVAQIENAPIDYIRLNDGGTWLKRDLIEVIRRREEEVKAASDAYDDAYTQTKMHIDAIEAALDAAEAIRKSQEKN